MRNERRTAGSAIELQAEELLAHAGQFAVDGDHLRLVGRRRAAPATPAGLRRLGQALERAVG